MQKYYAFTAEGDRMTVSDDGNHDNHSVGNGPIDYKGTLQSLYIFNFKIIASKHPPTIFNV